MIVQALRVGTRGRLADLANSTDAGSTSMRDQENEKVSPPLSKVEAENLRTGSSEPLAEVDLQRFGKKLGEIIAGAAASRREPNCDS